VFLFKYCRPDLITIIENLKIRFSPPSVFNDPFDGISDTAVMENRKWVEMIAREMGFEWPLMKEAIRAACQDERGKAVMVRIQKRILNESLRILCLSRVPPDDPNALLLWGHYATKEYGHDGFVIELDEFHPWIAKHRQNLEKYDAGDVDYREQRATWHGLEPERDTYFTKSRHWKYEKEYRLVRRADDPDLDKSPTDALAPFEPGILKSITLGDGASPETEDKLKQIVRGNPALAGLKLRRAEIHEDKYQLRLREIRV